MKITIEKIDCQRISQYSNSNRVSPFIIAKYQFFYQSEVFDRTILNKITEAGESLANLVNDKAANASTTSRNKNRKLSNGIAGVLAEYCWKNFLNTVSLNLLVRETAYTDSSNQVDLETLNLNKTIEVRSSFPRNGVEFAICSKNYEFDILGPYKNNYKPDEIQKDFYLRTLYHVPSPISFLDEYKKDGFTVYLTGGATWEMMADDTIAIEKNLIPEDEIAEVEVESTYRVIPFS
ncbi:MAG: hypothetical protein KDE33_22730, partial [Bacteroidetes bacterium]|nr:hypothetical protein [Bacteroidota bacterium]